MKKDKKKKPFDLCDYKTEVDSKMVKAIWEVLCGEKTDEEIAKERTDRRNKIIKDIIG